MPGESKCWGLTHLFGFGVAGRAEGGDYLLVARGKAGYLRSKSPAATARQTQTTLGGEIQGIRMGFEKKLILLIFSCLSLLYTSLVLCFWLTASYFA